MSEVRKYWVKGSWIFNLESMHDKLAVIEIDLQEGELQFPLEIAGRTINDWDALFELREEVYNLEWTAKSGKVTGREYGRIKEIVNWRTMVRYSVCMASGMNERDAGQCFADL